MRPVVISCVAEDAALVESLTVRLREAGFQPWRRPDDESKWSEKIDDDIRKALAVLTIASPASIHSRNVQYEWGFALGLGVAVLPLLVEVSAADLHPRLTTLQYLDFSDSSQTSWDALIRSLRKLEGALKPVTVQVPRDAPPILQHAAQALDGTDARERAEALAVLGEVNHPGAIEILAEAGRHHPVNEVRYRAAIHLAAHKDVRAIPALLEGIGSGFKDIEPWMLGNIGQAAAPALLEALDDDSDAVRDAAFVQLGRIGGSQAVAALIRRLHSGQAEDRRSAAYGLQYAGDAAAIPALIVAAQDSDRDLRRAAIDALVKCSADAESYDQILPVLVNALDDSYDQVAISAIEALARIRQPLAIEALVRAALTSKSDQVSLFSRNALESLGDAAVPVVRAAIPNGNSLVVGRAILILRRARLHDDVPLFISLSRHADAEVRHKAVCALWDQPAKEAVPALLERLNDSDAEVRRVTAGALGALKDPNLIPQLTEALLDEEDDVAEWAANALKEIGTRKALAAARAWEARAR